MDWRLAAHPRVVATPHVGAQTAEAQERVGTDIAVQVRDFLKGGIIQHAVNFFSLSGDVYDQVKPAMDLAERLGAFLAQACPGTPERIEVGLYGDLRELDAKPILAAAVCGVMRCAFPENVTLVNARSLAQREGDRRPGVDLVGQARLLEPDGHPAQDLGPRLSRWRGRSSAATTCASSTWTASRWTRSPRGTCCSCKNDDTPGRGRPPRRHPGPAPHQHRAHDRGPEAGQRARGHAHRGRQRGAAGRAGGGDDGARRARGARADTWAEPRAHRLRPGRHQAAHGRGRTRGARVVERVPTGVSFDGAALERGDLRLPRRGTATPPHAVGLAIPGLVGPGPVVQACDVLPGLVGWRPPASLDAGRARSR